MDKIKFFLDFDNTLFDTTAFRKDLFQIVEDFGFSKEEIDRGYKAVYGDGYQGIWAQLEYMNKNMRPIDLESVHKEINLFLKKCDRYLYKRSVELLRLIDRDKFKVILLTVGGLEFQKMKVESSGISKFFDDIIYTMDNKATELQNWVTKDELFILIDDKARELSGVAVVFSRALTYEADPINMTKYADPLILSYQAR